DDLKRSTADKVQKTLETVAGGFSASDEVSLWRFDEVPDPVADFIGDNDALLTQLKHIDLSSSFPGIGSAPMTNGPHVNTSQPPGPAAIPSMAAGHPNNKHINDAIYAAAGQLRDRGGECRISRKELEGLYARVTEQARNQYTIAYSGARTDRSKPYHTIEVRVRRPGLSLLTRDGYYINDKP